MGGVIVAGILVWQLNHPTTTFPSGSVLPPASAAPVGSPSGLFSVVFDGMSTLERKNPTTAATDVYSHVEWHEVFVDAPQSTSADMTSSTVSGSGQVTYLQGPSCSTTKWAYEQGPIMITGVPGAAAGDYSIPIPAVLDDTNGPNSTNVCPAYDLYLPPGDPGWFYANFPMQPGVDPVSGPSIGFRDAGGSNRSESWSGTVTVTPEVTP
ncbi:MAG: hypothetical protein ACRDGQ_11975 [Candidatus Limnocylindrales bacterium]